MEIQLEEPGFVRGGVGPEEQGTTIFQVGPRTLPSAPANGDPLDLLGPHNLSSVAVPLDNDDVLFAECSVISSSLSPEEFPPLGRRKNKSAGQ